MSLYPITILPADIAVQEPNVILSGMLIIIPIDLTTTNMVELTLQQMSNTQDYSLRAWLSLFRDGEALPSPQLPQPSSGIYPIMRWSGLPIVVYLPGFTPPANTVTIAVETRGIYNLNILNLTNELNYFGFGQTVLA